MFAPWAVSRVTALLVVAVVLLAVVGAAPALEPAAAQRIGPWAPYVVTALGDSVTSGAACSCSPFPRIYGALLHRRTGVPVTVHDLGVNGLDSAGLLARLHRATVAENVRRADIVLVTIGANDFADHHNQVVGGSCATADGTDCVRDEVASLKQHLATLLAEVRTLRGGRPTSVLVTGYWNVFEDGQAARDSSGAEGLRASIALTHTANTAISSVTLAGGAHYVDLFAPFQRRGDDIDSLLAPDGDHPDAAGHVVIAQALLAAGLPRLT